MGALKLLRETRVDRIAVRLDQTAHRTTPQGYLQVWGTVVSADTLLEYDRSDGAPFDGYVEFVPREEVSKASSLDTLRNAPVTFLHPPEPLTAANTNRYRVGTVVDVRWDGENVRVLHQIEEQITIDQVRKGEFELSLGYTALIDRTPGEFGERKYDAIQRDRVYNHDAIVPMGRAEGAQLDRIDSARPAFRCDRLAISKTQQNKERSQMAKQVKVGADTFEVASQVADKMQSMQDELDKHNGTNNDQDEDEDETEENSEKDDKTDNEDDSESNESNGRKDSGPVTLADVAGLIGSAIGGLRKDLRKDAARADEQRKKREDAAKVRSDDIALAQPYLPQSYKSDGKSSAEILYSAVLNTQPEMKPHVESKKDDAGHLRGIVAALRHIIPPAENGGGVATPGDPNVTRMDQARKKRDDQRRKTQARLLHKQIGNQAVEHVILTDMAQSAEKEG